MSSRILVTGGAGFIGSNLAGYYLEKGAKVTLYDNLSRPGVSANLDWLQNSPKKQNLTLIEEDIRNFDALSAAVKNQDVIFHEAGQTAVTTSILKPRDDFEVNAQGSFNLLEAVRQNNPEAVVFYASTNKVYGDLKNFELTEAESRYIPVGKNKAVSETQPLDFHSPYGCSKGSADQYFLDYARSYNLKTIVFRQSCIYGEHQFGVEDQGWVAHFAAQVLKGLPLTIFGNGKQVRDLLYIGDLLDAYDKALENIKVTAGMAYNIGGGIENQGSLLEVIDILKELNQKEIEVSFAAERIGDQKYYVSDTANALKDFNWKPETGINTGIERLYRWLSQNLPSFSA